MRVILRGREVSCYGVLHTVMGMSPEQSEHYLGHLDKYINARQIHRDTGSSNSIVISLIGSSLIGRINKKIKAKLKFAENW